MARILDRTRCISIAYIWVYLFIVIPGCQFFHGPPNKTLNLESASKLSDEALLDLIQAQTFQYFWDGAETNSGLIRERYHVDDPTLDQHLVTTGGTGFGIMAILVGIERAFITREQGFQRLTRIVNFLERVDRYQGAWSHWINGKTGDTVPFSEFDDGGDLVETAFLVQGLLCARQYFSSGNAQEKMLAQAIDELWRGVNWNFYRGQYEENALFWHWSPNHQWKMNFSIHGYNETLITYILGASSRTYPIHPSIYHKGWAMLGDIVEKDQSKPLSLVHQGNATQGGPLFWAHYSFLGLDPRQLEDDYANYWQHNVNHTRLNYEHCVKNPNNHVGYGPNCWGLTASYSPNFYAAHSPENDLGVISPTAALASMPYLPEESLAAARHFYESHGDRLWGKYGFYDAFHEGQNWYPSQYLAIDQGPIIVMIENHRSGMLWDLFMSSEEIQKGLDILGFTNRS